MLLSPQQILKRLWPIAKRSPTNSSPSTPSSTPRQLHVIYYDRDLDIVGKEEGIYELHFHSATTLEWKLVAGTQDDTAPFSIDSYVFDWGEEEWSQFPLNIASQLITKLAYDPKCQCGYAFHWINSSWHERYRTFLSTHRSSLDQCEQVFIWLACAFAPTNQALSTASWEITIKQSDVEATNPFLWSHIERDCSLAFDGQPIEFTNEQLKLIRLVHCYFMPFYLEAVRRHHVRVFHWERKALWNFDMPFPSNHERLEAHLQLRDWLQGKVAPEEIPRLLGGAR